MRDPDPQAIERAWLFYLENQSISLDADVISGALRKASIPRIRENHRE